MVLYISILQLLYVKIAHFKGYITQNQAKYRLWYTNKQHNRKYFNNLCDLI